MHSKTDITKTFREHKTLLIVIMVGLFLIELEIFAVAAMKSGRKSMLQISDQTGNIVLLSEGASLSQLDKSSFERTFGPLEKYRVRILTEENAFPFRAWFVAAVGLPVGLVLLFAFVVRAWSALFMAGGEQKQALEIDDAQASSGLERIVQVVGRFNVFLIGVVVFLAAVAYWILPNFIVYAGRAGLEAVARYKWAVLGTAFVLIGVVLWVIYLRYLLAKKSIEGHVEVEKYRLQLEKQQNKSSRIAYDGHGPGTPRQLPPE